MTIRELFREFRILKVNAEDKHDAWVSQAWLTAGLVNQRKLPELRTLLAKRYREGAADLRPAIHSLAEYYGLKVRKGKKHKKKAVN